MSQQEEKNFIRNKAAQLFSLLFVYDFPHRWPLFFNDLLQFMTLGPPAVDACLRILMAIDTEVVDREIVHTPQVSDSGMLVFFSVFVIQHR